MDVQLDKLKDCRKIFQEKKSAAGGKRPPLAAFLEYVREGDILVVTRLNRRARSTLHLCQIADELKRKDVELQVIDQNINTADATGRLLFNRLGAINQFETEIRSERQTDGIIKANQQRVKFGASKKLTEAEVEKLKAKRKNGVLIKNLMKEYSLSKASIYRYLC